jgi:hypothetical protein
VTEEQKKIEPETPKSNNIIYRKCKDCPTTIEITKGSQAEKFVFRCDPCYKKFVEKRNLEAASKPAPQAQKPAQPLPDLEKDPVVARRIKLFKLCMQEVSSKAGEIKKNDESIYFSPESMSSMVDTLFLSFFKQVI